MDVHQSESWSDDSEWTVTFSAAEGYFFPDGTKTGYTFTDKGPCETKAPIPPVQTMACGTNNDKISFPSDQPTGVDVQQSAAWSDKSEWTVTFSAAEGYILPDAIKTEYTFTDRGPCETDAPIPPVQTEVCGTNNDATSVPGDQPANVLVTQSDSWSEDSTWTVTFSAVEGYVLPDNAGAEYTFTDSGPCETDAPIPPVQTEVCGPNNDIITFSPVQPTGITLASDTKWQDNSRTVTFTIDSAYMTDDQTTFAFTDANIPCAVNLTVNVETSDGGSIVGSPWQLNAPLASQAWDSSPYREGTVSTGNRIEVIDLMPGPYRLVVSTNGYETVDEVITVVEGIEQQSISVQMALLPSPKPTETPEAPIHDPTPVPTTVSVSGLPETGSGPSVNEVTYLGGLLLIVAGLSATFRRWVSNRA